jgi:hypothetical protein
VIEHGWRNLDWTREPQVLEGIRPQIADEAKTAQFLSSKGVVLNTNTQAMFLDRVLPEFIAAILRLERVAGGNYEADERPSQFPRFEGGVVLRDVGGVVTVRRTPRTVNDVWITAARTVFSWAVRERLVSGGNPFEKLRVTEPKKVHLRETKAFTPEEAATILRAAHAIGKPRSTFEGALRWVPVAPRVLGCARGRNHPAPRGRH